MELDKSIREIIKSSILKFKFADAESTINNAQKDLTAYSPTWFDLETFRVYIEFVKHSLLTRDEAFVQLGKSLERLEKLIGMMKEFKYVNGVQWANYYKGLSKYSQAIAKKDDLTLFNEAEAIWNDLEQEILDGPDNLLIAELLLSKAVLYERYAKKSTRPPHLQANITTEAAIEAMLDKVQEQFFRLLLKIGGKEDSELKMRLNYGTARLKGLREEILGKGQQDLTKSGNIKIDSLGTISYYFLTARKYAIELEAAYFLCAIPLQLCKIISKYISESFTLDPPPDLTFRINLFTEQIKDCLDNCKKYNIAFVAEQAVELIGKVRDDLTRNNVKIQLSI